MAYPDFQQDVGSERRPLSGIAVDRSSGGQVRRRILYGQTHYEFLVKHTLNGTDKNSLETHFQDNKSGFFDFTWQANGQTYSCAYASDIEVKPLGGDWYDITVKLVTV